VEAAAAQVDYDSHAIQGVIQRQTIEDLPLNGRNSLQLAALEPGVTPVPGSIAQFACNRIYLLFMEVRSQWRAACKR
jgi:hypothetical protein